MQVSAFVTIFLRPNIQPCLGRFDFIFVYCFVGKLLYFLSGHFQESWHHFSEGKIVIVFGVVIVTLLCHPSFAVLPLLR